MFEMHEVNLNTKWSTCLLGSLHSVCKWEDELPRGVGDQWANLTVNFNLS